MINTHCKHYRESKVLTLEQFIKLSGVECKVGTLSSFEHGRSSNVKHFEMYIKVSKKLKDSYNFMSTLVSGVQINE